MKEEREVEISSDILSQAMTLLELFDEGRKERPRATVTQVGTEIIHAVVNCTLCKTITHQLFKMKVFSDGTKIKEEDLPSGTANDGSWKHYKAQVRACWNCREFLAFIEHSILVDMYLALYNPTPTKRDVLLMMHRDKFNLAVKEASLKK